ncbi:MAG: hypothetical protein J6C34_06755 [Oscillospiraceae bacterium]|nr:hypothetical protein [Oscillospiraceae bacterium]MBP1575297.1 hypothetical protein [Oscillospiraceae bacterium]MBQ8595767.1 hypothetical protein [Oscillospiraceae bacterium]
MAKKILAALLAAVMLVSFSGCSPAETISGWLDEAGALIPNDVEMIISQIFGTETETEEHEIYFSEGYVNMLKSGTYFMTYVLPDGTEVMYGSNGVRTGTSYPEPAELEGTEPQYDENGNEIEPEIPHEHIVLSEGIYYYIDDNQAKMFTVNPENYKAVPFEISAENIKLTAAGNESFAGKDCRFERYSTNEGDITFYFENTVLVGMKIEQGRTVVLENITAFNKYLNPSLVSMPDSYTIVQYWP